ncbi:hypothetical protein F4808DRAFT_462935 [Astrocystis sublimbata]|nr:hypothetical protein F4808DRAFT_462935 [Astrocystis sublimbata]
MEDWDHFSTEQKLKTLLKLSTNNTKWGWIVYRTCYKPELDTAWATFKSMVDARTRQRIVRSDETDIADQMDWVFVEDAQGLEGASCDELMRRFQKWARAENPE